MAKRRDIPDLSNISLNHLENYFEVKTDVDGQYFYDLTDTVYIDVANMNPLYYVEYDVKQGDTLYGISVKNYNTHSLWWVIATANDIDDPFELEAGRTIRLLKRSIVGKILTLINENS